MNLTNSRNSFYYRLNKFLIPIYIIVTLILIVYYVTQKNFYITVQCIAALLLIPIPKLLFKWFKLKPTQDLFFLYYLFCFLAMIGGSALDFYSKVPGWDKFLHFSSGFLMALVGFMIYCYLKKTNCFPEKAEHILISLFVISFTIALAAIWEFYEYALYVFFGIDAMRVVTTGIHDTLGDMIVCTIGGIITSYWILRYVKHNKSNYLLRICTHFYDQNPPK